MTSLAAWSAVWTRLGAVSPDEALYGQLLTSYAQPHRHYHTRQHLDECFVHLDLAQVRQWAERPDEIEMALWFHDAVYDTTRHDNEEKSANWAREAVCAQGLAVDVADRIHALVMATRHHAQAIGHDAALLIDIDLGILGAAPNRFAEYEAQVRQEYAWVPPWVYKRERGKVLQGFLNRPHIYATPHFQAAYEAQARENLRLSLLALDA